MQVNRFVVAGALALAALVATPAAVAAPCAGFTDVDDANPAQAPFCANVEWLKNRSITLGCASPPNPPNSYCPNETISRLSMAAFMNRLGTALTPVFLRKRQTAIQLGALNYSAQQTVCVTDPITITGFPRTAIITALLNAFTADGGMDLVASLVYSVEPAPTTWLPVTDGDGFAYGSIYAAFTPPHDISLRPFTFMNLNVGSTYRFAVQGVRTAGTGQNANTYCETHVQIVNRNGTSSPFDVPPDGLPPGRGF